MHEQISRLYQSPQTLRIVEIPKNDKAPIHSFAEAISADPLFVARLLRLANFVPGLAQRLTILSNAINVFGLDNLKALALGLSAFTLEAAQEEGENGEVDDEVINRPDLWEHALGCATVAARLASKLENVSPLVAFTAGFIHDVGKVLLYRYSKERFIAALSVALEKNVPSTEGEMLAFGIDHVMAAEEWCRKSELPLALQNVLRFHHQRLGMLPDFIDDESQRLIAIVQAADLTCESQAIGKAGDRGVLPRELRTALDFREEDWRDLLPAVRQEVESASQMFGFQRQDRRSRVGRQRAERKEALLLPKAGGGNGRGLVIPFPFRSEGGGRNDARQSLGKLAILVVEDHTSLCDLLSLYLERHGYHVRTASNGEGALEILSKEEIHLVLLDLMLPGVDGFEALRQINKSQYDKPPYIIVVSAGASEKDRKKVLELGANEYMPKPFHLMRLLERIQTVEKYSL
jgi:CheY-like chemotaxis protein